MSNDQPYNQASSKVDKGKRRADEPTERTPLITGTSSSGLGVLHEAVTPANSRNRSLRSQLTTVFLVSFLVCLLAFLLLFFLAWSYASRATNLRLEDAIEDGYIVVRGPDHVNVINVTRSNDEVVSVWLNMTGRAGVDAGAVIGVDSDEENEGLMNDIWKSIGRWGVRKLDRISVNISTIRISPVYDPEITLFNVDVPPVELPLSLNPPDDYSWLTTLALNSVRIQLPTTNIDVLLDFLKESWKHGSIVVNVEVGNAFVHGGSATNSSGWRHKVRGKLDNIRTRIRLRLPPIPGLPKPGRDVPFPSVSDFLLLKSFDVSSDMETNTLRIHASASVINPVPSAVNLTAPSLPFTISIPFNTSETSSKTVSLASVSTLPFALDTHPNVTVSMQGHVLPMSSSSFPVLSNFVSRYLSGESNTVLVSSPLIPPKSGFEHIEVNFPAPHPRPQVLRDVTIQDMKMKPTGTGPFLASGTVLAKLVLPKGINVGLKVRDVLPDLLIFDGEVPPSDSFAASGVTLLPGWHWHKKHKHDDEDDDSNPDLPPEPPLPDPLPEHAFAHLRPEDWVPAISLREDGDGEESHGATYVISAKVVDVPLQVLPGRQKEFSNFVGKVVFGSEGAIAGLQGVAAVILEVKDLPVHNNGRSATEMMLSGLPFQGNVHIRKKDL